MPLVVEDIAPPRPEMPADLGTIDVALTNGRRMTIPASLAPTYLATLLAVRDPK